MPKEIAKAFVFRSSTNFDQYYQTLQYTDGTTSCDCKGWTIKRKTANGERSCKHTRLVDMGMGEQACVRVKDYLPVVAAPRFSTVQTWRQSMPIKQGRKLHLEEV